MMQLSEEDRERLLNIVQSHNTMTLSTVDERGIPWSSILFYSANRDLSLSTSASGIVRTADTSKVVPV